MPKTPDRIYNVLDERSQRSTASREAELLSNRLYAAKFDERQATRLLRRHASRHMLLNQDVEAGLEFLIERALDVRRP
jgi:hypothetical protein